MDKGTQKLIDALWRTPILTVLLIGGLLWAEDIRQDISQELGKTGTHERMRLIFPPDINEVCVTVLDGTVQKCYSAHSPRRK